MNPLKFFYTLTRNPKSNNQQVVENLETKDLLILEAGNQNFIPCATTHQSFVPLLEQYFLMTLTSDNKVEMIAALDDQQKVSSFA